MLDDLFKGSSSYKNNFILMCHRLREVIYVTRPARSIQQILLSSTVFRRAVAFC